MDKKAIYATVAGAGTGTGANLILGNAGLVIVGTGVGLGLVTFACAGGVVGLAGYGLYKAVKKKNKA